MNRTQNVPEANSLRAAARRKWLPLSIVVVFATVWLALPAPAENQGTATASQTGPSAATSVQVLLSEAREALFVKSDLEEARRKAEAALRASNSDQAEIRLEALFLEMEAAALQGDERVAIAAALQIRDLPGTTSADPRIRAAIVRISDWNLSSPQQEPAMDSLKLQSKRDTRGKLQPPCQTRRAAAKFFSRQARYERQTEVREILGSCAPDVLAQLESPTLNRRAVSINFLDFLSLMMSYPV
ncbi:MAG: hypothetical protein AB7O65_10800 [Candidatus Korobacteraceae bacterium]